MLGYPKVAYGKTKMKVKILVIILLITGMTPSRFRAQVFTSGTIYGKVTSMMFDPLSEVEITLISETGKEFETRNARSNQQGEFEITGLPAGRYRIKFTLRGFRVRQVENFYLNPGAKQLLDIGLEVGINGDVPLALVSGQVQDSTNRLVKDATVSLLAAATGEVVRQCRTDRRGNFEMRLGEIPTQYILCAAKQGYQASATVLLVGRNELKKQQLILLSLKEQ